MMNVKIKDVEVECPSEILDNKFFIDLFDKQGKDIRNLLKAFGRKERRVIKDLSDSTVSLGVKAALKVIEGCGIKGCDIDMIIFTSQFPEYTCPSQALIVHNAINGKEEAMVMDMNVNCVGMVTALDTASRYLLQKKSLKRALIIGADYMTVHCKENDEMTYPIFGDAGCAMIIEKTEEDCGFIDSVSYTNSNEYDIVKYPSCGSSSLYNEEIAEDEKKLFSNPGDPKDIIEAAKKSVEKLLEDNELKLSDINTFCFSQGSTALANACIEAIGIEHDKFIYVGDRYGYTGTSSPFIAFYEGVKSGKIKRGDYIIFWSVGTNWTTNAVLMKY